MIDNPIEETESNRTYTINELCDEFGLSLRSLRFYEQRKLLSPARDGMARIFSHRDRARLQLILRGKRFGFSLSEIREMLDLYDQPDGSLLQMKAVLPKFRSQLEYLQKEHERLAATITELAGRCQVIEDTLKSRTEADENGG